jgi:pimeloyl-ACP methyl ester carboxylesterase
MSEERLHRAVSSDGTEIAGRVHGDGPPLVLVQPPAIDADLAYEALLPHLTERFTCYLPSIRGREPSGDNPDHSPPRLQEDINAFVDSIAEPVCLTGWSDGASLALGAAANSDIVAAAAPFEPSVWPLMRDEELARQGAMLEMAGAAVAAGQLVEASRIFHRYVCNENELDALDATYLERQAGIWPMLMQEIQQSLDYEGPQATDPEMLGQVAAPVLVLLAQETELDPWFTDSAHHIAHHVANGRVREIAGVGHFAPVVAPEPVATEMVAFFESVGT